MKIGLGIIAVSVLWVFMEAWLAYNASHNFFPSQVMERWGRPGIAIFHQGGMWGDLILLPAFFAGVVYFYGDSWDMAMVIRAALIGLALTLANHLLLIYTQEVPDPLGWKGEKWSLLIAMHFVYMATYIALLALFYFSSEVSVEAAVLVSVVVGVHVAFGTHVPLGMAIRFLELRGYPDFLGSPQLPYLTLVVWALMAGFAAYAAGWRAGVYVLLTGAVLFAGVATFAHFYPASGRT